MRRLYKLLVDNQISRREFVREVTALGVTVASANALVAGALSDATAAETGDSADQAREVSGLGSDLLAESLLEADVNYIFHGCGGGINRFFDAFVTRPAFKNFLATTEGQCIAMAEGYHIASGGELGMAIIPRPGLMNAAGNILNAMAHRSSVLVLTARETNEFSERRGNNELVEWEDVLNPFMKWSYKMQQVERIPEFTRRAIKVAHAPLGGPTFLGFTENLFITEGTGTIVPQSQHHVQGDIEPDEDVIAEVAKLLLNAEKPIIVPGLEVSKSNAVEDLVELSELLAVPVSQGLSLFADFPSMHPLSIGGFSRYNGYMRGVDLVIVIGTQMPDPGHYITTGPLPKGAKVVHISMDPDMLAMAEPTNISLVSDAGEAIRSLTSAVKEQASKRKIRSIRDAHYEPAVKQIQANRDRLLGRAKRKWDQAPITNARLSIELNDALEKDAIVVSESLFGVAEWFDFGPDAKMQIGPQPGEALGWATGVALGAKLAQPDKQVIALSGDGAFMFSNNLWALSRYDAPVLIVIYNNQAYNMNRAFGWIRGGAQAEQKKDMLTYLGDPNVDFTLLAKAHDIEGEIASDPADLRAAIERGLAVTASGRPYLLDVRTERWGAGGDLEWHPGISIAELRNRKV
ncbi:MAG: thiamine pyrophosphate-binding protein [Gammaproteobacteria bacterium]|jgi:acetolactate synthase-1/2/3 large subunit|nr:thiamine pyrophosphate-binding protein [Gammaproteobacteria bacterium]MDP6616910.1 thiamine pyrophosphate-binding protein [Gammaproteobacteria bacterium]MDP6694950.1 thiamine pyrophosphate-binding protein [Gammaproteobacteria bacterium]